MLKAYVYSGCDTCRKALKFLDAKKTAYTAVPIRETPPSLPELKAMLEAYGGDLRKLFNTSGRDYKELGLSAKLPAMTEAQALALLAKNGNLVKRPFLIGKTARRVGFREEEWAGPLA
ncbi:MAG: arsenate reductase family protein [Verrucomicrobium sp.]|nr:arsenate reductase family protein [Verrucomicrobium sp.]